MHHVSRTQLLLLLAGLTAIAGCGTSSAASGAADGSLSADAASDGGDDGAVVCNTFEIVTPVVTQVAASGPAPVPAGGMVVDGVYLLTAENRYAGEAGTTPPMGGTTGAALQAMQGTWQYAVSENGGPYTTDTATVTYSGTTVTQTFTCPELTQMRIQEYTATATQLRIYTSTGGWVDEAVFTLR